MELWLKESLERWQGEGGTTSIEHWITKPYNQKNILEIRIHIVCQITETGVEQLTILEKRSKFYSKASFYRTAWLLCITCISKVGLFDFSLSCISVVPDKYIYHYCFHCYKYLNVLYHFTPYSDMLYCMEIYLYRRVDIYFTKLLSAILGFSMIPSRTYFSCSIYVICLYETKSWLYCNNSLFQRFWDSFIS